MSSAQCSKVGVVVGAPQLAVSTNQIPLLILRLDYFNISSRRKFHLAFSSFLLQIKKYTRRCHDRRLASYSGVLPFFSTENTSETNAPRLGSLSPCYSMGGRCQ